MPDFWPRGLELNDTQSPMEVLQEAQRDWESNSNRLMTLVLQSAKSQSGNDMTIVHAKHLPSNRTASLFAVVYRPANPYPATIQPKGDELPDLLKKSYYQPGSDPFGSSVIPRGLLKTEGRTVTNQWVSDTPSEFREKLMEVFNLGIIKSEVLNLTCRASAPDVDEEDNSPTPQSLRSSA